MRTFKSKFLLAIMVLSTAFAFSQEGKSQMFTVHEDQVKPSMVNQYEQVAKQLVDNMKKYDVQGTSWICSNTSDFRYLYVSPIENMAALDNNIMAPLFEKMGDEAGKMFEKMDECYDKHIDYIIHLNPELSYQPGGINQTPEGLNARKFIYLYVTPQNAANLYEAMKGVKELFAKKNSTNYYRVYQSGFGAQDKFYMVAIAGKDPVDIEASGAKNDQLLGEDRVAVFNEVLKYVSRFEEYNGVMRSDLAYSPKKN